jgi:uncharacterized protein
MRILRLIVLGIVTALGTDVIAQAAEPELKGTPTDLQRFLRSGTHNIVLVGHAKQTVQADMGHVSIIVHTQGKDLSSAIAANGLRREALAQALQSQGVDVKAMHAQKFSTSPQYGWFGKTPNSYEVNNRLTVDVGDEHQLTVVTAAAGQSPDLSIGAIVFEYSKQQELEEQVRHSAFDDALAKKAFYEQRLGAALRPTEFQFSDFSERGTAGALALQEIVVTAQSRAGNSAFSSPPPVPSFDEKEYEVSVTVTFAVEPAAGTAR